MNRQSNAPSKRRIAILFAAGHIVLCLVVTALVWALLRDDDFSVKPGVEPPVIHSLEIDDGGPPGLDHEPGPQRSDRSAPGEVSRPMRSSDMPGRRQQFRFVFAVGGISILLLSAGAFLLWHVIAGALDRSAANAARFTADVAHELKTPLAVMQSVVEHAIKHSGGNEAVERFGADVLEEVTRLKSLVQRLLILAQSDAGRLPLKKEKIDFSALAKLLAEDISLMADAVDSSVEDGLCVTGDRSFLTQALQNIVSNAVKYNREGFTIGIKLAKVGSAAVLTVSNGVDPLAPPDVARLFDRFYRGETARGSKLEGAGLGLSLAKEVVESSGGTIAAAIEGDRILFRVSLPLG